MSATPDSRRERHRFTAGYVLFREGDRSRLVYRLTHGEVEVTRRTASGAEVVGRVGPGEYLGEIGVLMATRRSGTARFAADAEIEVFSRDEFLRQAAADATIGRPLVNVLSLRSRANMARLEHEGQDLPGIHANRGEGTARFLREGIRAWLVPRRLDARARALLAHADVRSRTLARGEVLFEQGDPPNQVSWIESGRLRVVRRREGAGAHTIGHAWSGEFVGEMGVLESRPRTAAAIAATKVSVRELPPGLFLELIGSSPKAFVTVVESLCDRAQRLLQAGSQIEPDRSLAMGGFFDAVQSVESVSELAQRRVVEEARRASRFFEVQVERGKFVGAAYQRYLEGTVTTADMERANGYFRDYVKLAGIGTLFMLPGGSITVPLAAKIGQALGVDVFPAAVED